MSVRTHEQSGFTLIELLVALALFSVLSAGFYAVMFSGVDGSDTARSVVRISEEARLGFNRMIRDTREAERIVAAGPTSYGVEIDFDTDGVIEDANGEVETFSYDAVDEVITLSAGGVTEALVRGVEPVAGEDMFSFSSNLLEYDRNDVAKGFVKDGVATWQEVDQPPSGTQGGNRNNALDVGEFPYLSNVNYAFRVRSDERVTRFYAGAQVRNRR
jgi:prepilin-type N-terminal cleavage/methylation domain-containing protein